MRSFQLRTCSDVPTEASTPWDVVIFFGREPVGSVVVPVRPLAGLIADCFVEVQERLVERSHHSREDDASNKVRHDGSGRCRQSIRCRLWW